MRRSTLYASVVRHRQRMARSKAQRVPASWIRFRPYSEPCRFSDTPILQPGAQVSRITPHVLIVHRGEDVVQKILLRVRDIPGTSFILSANGDIATVTTDLPHMPGRTISYEGYYTLVSLRGTFMPVEDGYYQSRASGLRVSFSGEGAQVFGGLVEGAVIAASTIQIVLGSYTSSSGF